MKKRLMFQRLMNFVETDSQHHIALLSGIRRTGKTTLLKQVGDEFEDRVIYIDLSKTEHSLESLQNSFLDTTNKLFLLDEITYLDDYESIVQELYNVCAERNHKVIITGSSSSHLLKLGSTKLGARCRFFRLPLLTFVEYLYFTEKIVNYSDYNSVTEEHFKSYLTLEGIEGTPAHNLALVFDSDYLSALYEEVNISNQRSKIRGASVDLKPDDLRDLIQILAYKLSEAQGYNSTSILESLSVIPGMTVQDVSRIMSFMLRSGMASVEHYKASALQETASYSDILYILESATTQRDLDKVLKNSSICLVSPLYYSFIGSEIFKVMGVDRNLLGKGVLYGKMLEVYVRGALALYGHNSILNTTKINFDGHGEVDIFDAHNRILCEISSRDKKDDEISVYKYYPQHDFVRICTSKEKDIYHTRLKFYHIPYAKLCCMIDTGDIMKLSRSKGDDSLTKSNVFVN